MQFLLDHMLHLVVPGSSGLSRAYASSSRQLSLGFYSTGTGATGSSATQLLDLILEDMDPSSAQFLSGPSARIGVMDGVSPHGSKLNSVSFSSVAPTLEVHPVEASNVGKGLGATALSLPAAFTKEHPWSASLNPC